MRLSLDIPSWMQWYKKPDYRDIKEYSRDIGSGKRSFSPDGRRGKSYIPSRLKLDRVLANKTCMFLSSSSDHRRGPRLTLPRR